MILKAPKSLLPSAKQDLEKFIRDIACVPRAGIKPFFRRRKKVMDCVKDYINPFNPQTLQFDPNFKCKDDLRRYMHIDLGINRDSCGIAMSHVPSFVDREEEDRKEKRVLHVKAPLVKIDFWGKIKVSKKEELILSDIREIVYDLSRRGFYFGLITFDRFQSIDSIQILRSSGYIVGHFSLDRTANYLVCDMGSGTNPNPLGYRKISTDGNRNYGHQCLKDLIYDDRLHTPKLPKYYEFNHFTEEVIQAQEIKGKVDHPPTGSIDVEQAVAGACTHAVVNEHWIVMSDWEEREKEAQDNYYSELEKERREARKPLERLDQDSHYSESKNRFL